MTVHCPHCHRPVVSGATVCAYCSTPVEVPADPGPQGSAGAEPEAGGEENRGGDPLAAGIARLPEWSRRLLADLDRQYGTELPEWQQRLAPEGRLPRWLGRRFQKPEPQWILDFFATTDHELGRLWIEAGCLGDDSEWSHELLTCSEARIARAFILHGNINDYHFHPHLGHVQLRQFLLAEFGPDVTFYSLSQGLETPGSEAGTESVRKAEEHLWQQIKSDFDALDRLLRGATRDGVVVVIHFIDKLFPASASDLEREFLVEMILRWAVDPSVPENNLILLTTTNYEGLHPDLRSRVNKVQAIEIPRPRRRARLKYVAAKLFSMQANARGAGRTQLFAGNLRFAEDFGRRRADQVRAFADQTSGLNLMGIEDVILRAITENAGMLEVREVSKHKRNLLAGESVGLLEMIEPRHDFGAVGGLAGVRERLLEVCRNLRNQNPLVQRTLPMGILFLGPPGTGKSLVAEALAKASGLSFVKLGNFRDMYVGQSEKNLSIVLQLLRSLVPVVVFVDEIDQTIGQRGDSSESGPEKRLFAKLLEFMSDTSLRGRVLWIGASNEPDQLDEAFKRPGRFDLKLPFFLPERDDRRSIFQIMIAGKGEPIPHGLTERDFDELAAGSDGFSGAEIEVVVHEALRLAIRDDAERVRLVRRHFDEVLARYDPGDTVRKYRALEAEIAREVPHADLLPERYRTAARAGEGS